jgi:hypothetical protein
MTHSKHLRNAADSHARVRSSRRELPDELKHALGRPVRYHPELARLCGDPKAALLLSQALYCSQITSNRENWFYKNSNEWQEETGLSGREQARARKILIEFPFWEEERRGVCGTLHFRVRYQELLSCLWPLRFDDSVNTDSTNPLMSNYKRRKTGFDEFAEHYKEAKTTAETTTEITSSIPPTPLSQIERPKSTDGNSDLLKRFWQLLKSDLMTAPLRSSSLSDDWDTYFRDSWPTRWSSGVVYLDSKNRGALQQGLQKYGDRLIKTFCRVTGHVVEFLIEP